MTSHRHQAPDVAAGEVVIEEFLRTALWLFDVSTSLTAAIRENVRDDLSAAAEPAKAKEMLL